MSGPRVVAVIQARTGSRRLAGKVLADLGGRPVVRHLIDTALGVAAIDEVVLAIPFTDTPLEEIGRVASVMVVTGPEDDVLERFHRAAVRTGADVVIRLTADCPLLDAEILAETLGDYLADPVDYLTVEEYPRGTADIEIVSAPALRRIHARAIEPYDREHVCTFVGSNPDRFSVRVARPPEPLHRPDLRLCVDEPVDLEVVREAYRRLDGARPTVTALIDVMDADPPLAARNAAVTQTSHNPAATL